MFASELARAERAALCEALEQAGPDHPTLCEGWTARELAAHVVVRESRPDAALGVLGGPLSAWTERVQNGAAEEPFDKLVKLIRNGPPIWSAFRVPMIDGQANTLEYFVHCEDVRRSQPGWTAREHPADLQDFIWDRLRTTGRLLFSKCATGVVLRRADIEGEEPRARVKGGEPAVTLVGRPTELALIAHGRSAADVEFLGEAESVAKFRSSQLGA